MIKWINEYAKILPTLICLLNAGWFENEEWTFKDEECTFEDEGWKFENKGWKFEDQGCTLVPTRKETLKKLFRNRETTTTQAIDELLQAQITIYEIREGLRNLMCSIYEYNKETCDEDCENPGKVQTSLEELKRSENARRNAQYTMTLYEAGHKDFCPVAEAILFEAKARKDRDAAISAQQMLCTEKPKDEFIAKLKEQYVRAEIGLLRYCMSTEAAYYKALTSVVYPTNHPLHDYPYPSKNQEEI